MNNTMCVLMGKSASGKSSLVEKACKDLGIKAIPSYTTRPPRYDGEEGHTFVTDEQYSKLKDIIAENNFCGKKYCVTLDQIENPEYSLYVCDCTGLKALKEMYAGERTICPIQITCDEKIRAERLKHRYAKISKNEVETLQKVIDRLVADADEFRDIDDLSVYCVDNTFSFEDSYNQFRELLCTLLGINEVDDD